MGRPVQGSHLLARENARLLAAAEAMSGDAHLLREAAPWRDASPVERIAETWRLCALGPWVESLWSEDVRAAAARPEPLPADTQIILERLKQRRTP